MVGGGRFFGPNFEEDLLVSSYMKTSGGSQNAEYTEYTVRELFLTGTTADPLRVSLNHILSKQNREYKNEGGRRGRTRRSWSRRREKPLHAHLLQAAQESRKEQPKIRRS